MIADGRATLVELLRRRAAAHPDAIAVEDPREALTYAALDRAADALGAQLRARGVQPGDLVAVRVERSCRMHVAVLGIGRAGAAYLPIDPGSPEERTAFILADSGATATVTDDDTETALRSPGAVPPPLESDPARLLYTIYTSGSTGKPKGVLVEERSVVNLLDGFGAAIPLGPGDTLLAVVPLAFDVSVLDLYWPLTRGARIVVATREEVVNPKALIARIERSGATHMQATPSTWRMLVDAGWRGAPQLRAISGGEPLPVPLADALLARSRELWNVYGPTEATVWATMHRVRAAGEPPAIGAPIPNVGVFVIDEQVRQVPDGVIGELAIGGAGVARGYLRRPELTADRFVPNTIAPDLSDRLYRTGDLARVRADGTLECLGRLDTQVKLHGHRIELGEVEAALVALAGVAAAVAVVRTEGGEQRMIAYVVPAPGAALGGGALRRALARSLPAYMIPSAIVLLETLPLNGNGKVDRGALPPPPPRAPGDDAHVAPRTSTERRLTAIWEEVLDVRPIGVTDDFFELGATSIAAARVFDRIERELGARLPLSPLFAAPTVERLAALIDGGTAPERRSSLVAIQPHGALPPVFCVHGGAGTILHFHALARLLGAEQPFYGLQMRGLYGGAAPHFTVEAMAAHYLRELRAVQPRGPYRIGGYCFGALVAFEMARRLEARGERVALLFAINGPSPAYIRRYGAALKDPLSDRLLVPRARLRGAFGRPLPDRWRGGAILRICHAAERAYRPQPYPGALLLFAGEGLYLEPDAGWQPFVRGGLEIATVPGRHYNQRDAMYEPKVGAIADRLRAVLVETRT
jgi:amino acid adenylation domain-containing protein